MSKEQCRVCLQYRRNLISIFDKIRDKDINYLDMMVAITNKVTKLINKTSNKLCILCSKKLKEAYEFKLFIEKSNAMLESNSSLSRIYFNNLDDIKMAIAFPFYPTKPSFENITKTFTEAQSNSFTYKDISISKVLRVDEENIEPINSDKFSCLKEELETYWDNADDCSNVQYKNYTSSHKKNANKENTDMIHIDKPIKPMFIDCITVKRTVGDTLNKKHIKKSKYRNDMCPYCGKFFKCIKSHILTHVGERKYQCNKCPKTFLSQTQLKTHVMKLHGPPKTFKCDKCIATFSQIESFKMHQVIHTSERNFICDNCNKSFRRKSTLTRHLALIHNKGVKTHVCEFCHKICKSTSSLKHHIRIHTRERPFKCEICSQPYSYKRDFNRHCLKRHGIVIKLRPIYVMNEEILKQERVLMKTLAQNIHSIDNNDLMKHFEGPLGYQALQQTIEAIESRQIPISI